MTVITDAGEFRVKIVGGADGSNGVTRRCVLPNVPVHTARVLEVLTPVGQIANLSQAQIGNLRYKQQEAFVDFYRYRSLLPGIQWL